MGTASARFPCGGVQEVAVRATMDDTIILSIKLFDLIATYPGARPRPAAILPGAAYPTAAIPPRAGISGRSDGGEKLWRGEAVEGRSDGGERGGVAGGDPNGPRGG